jgi:hypothetical protein
MLTARCPSADREYALPFAKVCANADFTFFFFARSYLPNVRNNFVINFKRCPKNKSEKYLAGGTA